MRVLRLSLIASITAIVLGAPCWCASITGTVRDRSTRKPIPGVVVRAYAEGRSMGVAAGADKDGRFRMDDLAPGLYSVCVGATENWRPQVTSVEVTQEDTAEVVFSLAPSIAVEGDSWLQGYPVFHQSFTATGLGVNSLKLKGFGPGRVVKAQLLKGEGTSGTPIGPPRTTASFGGEGETAVYWSGGEAPTVPGWRYTFRLSAEEGRTWMPGVAGKGDVYPLGQAYFAAEARPLSDLGFSLCEENDNLTTNYAVAPGRRAMFVRAVGQTFTARSSGIRFAAASLQGAIPRAVYVRFSIHEDGPGGAQVGPSKSTGLGMDSAVAWLPGEVRVTPGKTYYLHIESYDGTKFYAYEELDPYAGGSAFNDAVADARYDLAARVAGEISEADMESLLMHPRSERFIDLANPSFEDGTAGWTLTKEIGRAVGCDGGVIPPWGERMFGWTNRKAGEGSRTIIYQNVEVTRGRRYSFSGHVYTDRVGGRSSDQKVRMVVDPEGGARFENDNMESSQWYATEGEWRRGSVEFKARTDRISVGFELEQRWSLDLCSLYVDGARLDLLRQGE